jgi:hypothetical protein
MMPPSPTSWAITASPLRSRISVSIPRPSSSDLRKAASVFFSAGLRQKPRWHIGSIRESAAPGCRRSRTVDEVVTLSAMSPISSPNQAAPAEMAGVPSLAWNYGWEINRAPSAASIGEALTGFFPVLDDVLPSTPVLLAGTVPDSISTRENWASGAQR